MSTPASDTSKKVVLLRKGAREEVSLEDAVRTVMQLTTLSERLTCTILRNGSPLTYVEIVRIHSRHDPRGD